VIYVDGRERRALPQPGDFFHWKQGTLRFGAEAGSDDRFRGAISHVALHARELSVEEVRASAERALAVLDDAPAVPYALVEARLLARSRIPTLDEISPYRRALATEEWEVVRPLAGVELSGRVRVARWMLLDGRPTVESAEPLGTLRRLRLEPYADQPQLESVVLSDTLPPPSGGTPPLGFDVSRSGG
jgi:Concanavalin A-like lectin/glucanases superfamily